ncbi:MAG TPA: NADH-ubiquinone oxidoreductase-F iron-sulfur binding region domain-containing protein [Acidobacteriota bacterium]|nr:NADH-ubiquinone oxidoreductase-F iron-sulfur binding region domain-containing protein [Acidobacteriota bacterium]
MIKAEVLLRFHETPGIETLDIYRRFGGYEALAKAGRMSREDLLALIEASGLRGRGGAGFPAGVKLRAMAQQPETPHYFICNIAEGEPGSFKDRALLRNPHQVLEATAIAAHAAGAEKAFIYLRGSYREEERLLRQAFVKATAAGLLGQHSPLPIEIVIHRGEDSYIAGEETALIESLEGKPAIPRSKPPRPYERGLFDMPTLVHNVETICNMIPIVLYGVDAFRGCGTAESPGTKLFCLSGQIARPGLYELPLGVRLSALLQECGGGPLPGRRLVAVFPGGPSTPAVPVERDPEMSYEGLERAGSRLGTGGVVVVDDSTIIPNLAVEVSSFFARESCGACPPCTIGTSEVHKLLQQIAADPAAARQNILKIREFCEMMKPRGSCAHGRSAAFTVQSLLEGFPDAFSS